MDACKSELTEAWPFPRPDKVLPAVLQKAEVGILSQSECKRRYGPVSPRMLCAGVPSGEQDACRVREPSLFHMFLFY